MDLEDLNYVIAQRDRFSPKFLYRWFFTLEKPRRLKPQLYKLSSACGDSRMNGIFNAPFSLDTPLVACQG
jgi:hypothetical protein